MRPVHFPEANTHFTPPPDLEESQCLTVSGYSGTVRSGSVDGSQVTVVAWKLTEEEIEALRGGALLYVSMLGGLAPHLLTLSFHDATHPA